MSCTDCTPVSDTEGEAVSLEQPVPTGDYDAQPQPEDA